ncbi:MAG: hypothetical protein WCS70_00985 [Verrucomicrobiota bacterium]
MNHDFPVKVCVLFALGLTGCEQNDIKVYTVPKEQSAPPAMPDGHADHAAEPAPPKLKWNLPAGWKEGAPSEFRVASFRVKGPAGKEADVSIVPLPGAAGGELSNVNRWRGQVSQPPVSETELKALAQPVELAGQSAELYEQAGAGPNGEPLRILAVIQHRTGTAWFYKMTGDDQLVAQQKPVFVEFLKSLQFATTETAPAANADKPQWTPPGDWTEVTGGQFLVAKFTIAGGQAAVNISSSAGDGGGLAANVNRWRKQLGLGEQTSDELAKAALTRGSATFVEMSGTDARSGQPAALVGAMVLQPGQAWFYKLMGDAKIVAAQKDAFSKFVQEAKY